MKQAQIGNDSQRDEETTVDIPTAQAENAAHGVEAQAEDTTHRADEAVEAANDYLFFDADEDIEVDPLAELERMLDEGEWSEKQAQEIAYQFALQRSATNLLQAIESGEIASEANSHEASRPAQLLCSGHFILTGVVRGEHFHVFDTLSTGYSARELTGESPTYAPIPLEKIISNAAQGDVLRYLDQDRDLNGTGV